MGCEKEMRRKLTIVLVVLFLFVLCVLVFKQKLLLAVGNFLIIKDDLHPVDVIHVIAGEDYRTYYAIQLYQEGYAKFLFFTGGWCEIHKMYHGEHAQQLALANSVPSEAIIFDDSHVTSTYSETLRLKAWMDQSPVPIQSVIVVSDPFHMRRSRWTYRHVLGKKVEILMAPVPFIRTPYQPRWWENWQSKKYVKDEYLKFFYYIARYQLSWGRLREWLVSFDTQ
jgi:uncharacterized SAM-binding protein YcdF (DUF218 family)